MKTILKTQPFNVSGICPKDILQIETFIQESLLLNLSKNNGNLWHLSHKLLPTPQLSVIEALFLEDAAKKMGLPFLPAPSLRLCFHFKKGKSAASVISHQPCAAEAASRQMHGRGLELPPRAVSAIGQKL